jgi:TolA-binding protein
MPALAIPAPRADEPLVATEPSVLQTPAVPLESEPVAASNASAKPEPVATPVAADATAAKRVALRPPTGRIAKRDSPIEPAGTQNVPPEIRPALPIQPDSLANPSLPPISPDPHVARPPNEHALLTAALRRLRTEHDPASALAALDDYRLRFPSGGFAPEAAMLRAEAFLQIGRKGDALDELDRLSLGQMPNSDERYVLRGELRAAVGRWREALRDFDVVLRGHAGEEAEIGSATDMKLLDRLERALWGRALARSRLGNDAGARADLRECLRRFPRGHFASEATRLLGGQR